MALAEKVITIADNTQAVCEAVKGAKVDVSGAVVSVGDVSSVEHSVGVRLTSKNLFDSTTLLQAQNWQESGGVYYGRADYLYATFKYANGGLFPNYTFKENTQYTFSFNGYNEVDEVGYDGVIFGFKYTDGTDNRVALPNSQDFADYILTSVANKTIERLFVSFSGGCDVYIRNIQLEESTTATPYTPYTDTPTGSVTVQGKNYFDISKVADNTNGYNKLYNNGDGTITVVTTSKGGTSIGKQTLREYAPNLKAGETYFLSAYSTPVEGSTMANNYIYLQGTGANVSWLFNSSKTVTEEMLNAKVLWYAWAQKDVTTTISNIQIELGTTATAYEPYQAPTTYTANADGIVDGVRSLSPSMVLTTDNDGVVINARYFPESARGMQIAYGNLVQEETKLRDSIREGVV